MRAAGFEPATSGISGRHLFQLGYARSLTLLSTGRAVFAHSGYSRRADPDTGTAVTIGARRTEIGGPDGTRTRNPPPDKRML